jgi:hypothetical protein
MRKLLFALISIALIALPCFAQSTEPIGPTGWTLRNWTGFFLQIAIFILAVIAICKLANWGED